MNLVAAYVCTVTMMAAIVFEAGVFWVVVMGVLALANVGIEALR